MKILVVDDHVLIRDALRGVLKELKADAEVLEASDCRQAMALIAENADDLGLILLDLGLPDRDGFSALAEVRKRYPAISVVVLSGQHDRASVVKALDLGALGFIPKSGQREVMLSALQLVFAGGIYIPPEILTRDSSAAPQPGAKPTPSERPHVSPSDLGLTERQVDVLALMMQGKSNKAICRVLDLAEPTVKNHVTAILKALKVTNRTEAVIAVRGLGWELGERSDAQKGQRTEGRGDKTLTVEQKTKVRETVLRRGNAPRVTNVNFRISVGTVVPTTVRVVEVPPVLIEYFPDWRGYFYFIVNDEIIIVDCNHHIVAILEV